jgi:hypothetical protein
MHRPIDLSTVFVAVEAGWHHGSLGASSVYNYSARGNQVRLGTQFYEGAFPAALAALQARSGHAQEILGSGRDQGDAARSAYRTFTETNRTSLTQRGAKVSVNVSSIN